LLYGSRFSAHAHAYLHAILPKVYFATVAATFASSFSHVRIICLLIGTYHDQDRNFLFFFHEITLCFVVVKYVRHDQNAKEMWNNDQKHIE